MKINKPICLFLLAIYMLSSCKSILNKEPKETVDIAIFLPLSGPSGNLGSQCEKMIKLGLKDNTQTYIKATSYDISTTNKLQEAINKVKENGTEVILGPINYQATKIVANSLKYDPIIVSLSNNPTLATGDNNLFVLGHAPMKQFSYLVGYLLENGHKNYILMLRNSENNRYTTSKILQHMIATGHGNLLTVEYYDNDKQSIVESVKKITQLVDEQNEMDYNLKKTVILISDNQDVVRMIFDTMLEYRLDQKSIIAGDNKINIPYNKPINFVYTGSSNEAATKLEKEIPDHISFMDAISYDAGSIVAKAIGEEFNKEKFIAYVNSPEFIFEGISGTIKFSDKIAERNYSIVKEK